MHTEVWVPFAYRSVSVWQSFFKHLLLLLLSHFSRVRLCDPTDGSPPGSPVPGILQAGTGTTEKGKEEKDASAVLSSRLCAESPLQGLDSLCTALRQSSLPTVQGLEVSYRRKFRSWAFPGCVFSPGHQLDLLYYLTYKSKSVSCSVVSDSLWHQAPGSMGFSREEYWSGLPGPPPGDLPDPGIEPGSPALQVDSLPSELLGKHLTHEEVSPSPSSPMHHFHHPFLSQKFWFLLSSSSRPRILTCFSVRTSPVHPLYPCVPFEAIYPPVARAIHSALVYPFLFSSSRSWQLPHWLLCRPYYASVLVHHKLWWKNKPWGDRGASVFFVGLTLGQALNPVRGFPGSASGKDSACQCRRHETRVPSVGQEDPLEEGMATHSSILAWKLSWQRSLAGCSP